MNNSYKPVPVAVIVFSSNLKYCYLINKHLFDKMYEYNSCYVIDNEKVHIISESNIVSFDIFIKYKKYFNKEKLLMDYPQLMLN